MGGGGGGKRQVVNLQRAFWPLALSVFKFKKVEAKIEPSIKAHSPFNSIHTKSTSFLTKKNNSYKQ